MFWWWRQRIKHEDWDVKRLHLSKWDVLEANGLSRTNAAKFPTDVIEVQVYGVKYYLECQKAADFIIKNYNQWTQWN